MLSCLWIFYIALALDHCVGRNLILETDEGHYFVKTDGDIGYAEVLSASGPGTSLDDDYGDDYTLKTADEESEVDFSSSPFERGECLNTIGGPGEGKPCIFPFTFAKTGKKYTECTTDGGHEYWCSTKVDDEGFHLSGNWGECGEGCPGVPLNGSRVVYTHCPSREDEAACIFPFSIDGYSYKGCLPMEGFDHGFCMIQHPEIEDKLKKAPCSNGCPKDEYITHIDLSVEEILTRLLTQHTVFTTIDRDGQCGDHLQAKFEEVNQDDLPEVAKSAKTWKEAHSLVCRNSEYCAGNDSKACRTKMVEKRRNKVQAEDGGQRTPKSDCKIRCGHPE